ncbi:MAG: SOS response-associated peptidase family protein [Clostridia bacterium]
MCGRFNMSNNAINELKMKAKEYNAEIIPDHTFIAGEIFPMQNVLILYYNGKNLELNVAVWGVDSPFAKGNIINARSETVAIKPYFASDFRNYRCVVACDCYYEWSKEKNKYAFSSSDDSVIFLAGFCKPSKNYNNLNSFDCKKVIENRFIILTKQASQKMLDIHDREPCEIEKHSIYDYLTKDINSKEAAQNIKKLLSTDYVKLQKQEIINEKYTQLKF